jgi:hypothetical protein
MMSWMSSNPCLLETGSSRIRRSLASSPTMIDRCGKPDYAVTMTGARCPSPLSGSCRCFHMQEAICNFLSCNWRVIAPVEGHFF